MAVRNPIGSWLDRLLYGPVAPYRGNDPIALHENTPPPLRTSWVYDSHIVTQEAASSRSAGRPQSISLAWDERDAWGLDMASRSWQGLTPQDRKQILLDIYIQVPWVSACIDVIAKRICSGGVTVEKVDEELKDNNAHYDQLMEFVMRVNDDWDFLQWARSSFVDEMIYGETYSEILPKAGLPWQLVKIDCLTMGYKANRWGQIEKFKQELPMRQEVNWLDAKDIIRWWFPHPRASIDPFAPAEKVSDAVLLDKKMVNWMTTFFQKGAKFPYYVKFPGDENEAERYKAWFDQNVTGEKNAHRPPIAWGNAEFVSLGNQGALDIDFDKGADKQRTIIFAAFGVPPAAVSIIESGNIGGGTGEDQDKSLQYNACDPVKQQFLEKLNFRITQKGFNIRDYRIGLRYADYRSDESLAKVADLRIRNGSRTINETRSEEGKKPYKAGGDVAIVVASKDIIPVPRFDDMEDEQAQSAQLDIETKQIANDKAKEPPQPVPAPLANGQQQPVTKNANIVSQNNKQAANNNKNVISDKSDNNKEANSDQQKANTQGKTSASKQQGKNKSESVAETLPLSGPRASAESNEQEPLQQSREDQTTGALGSASSQNGTAETGDATTAGDRNGVYTWKRGRCSCSSCTMNDGVTRKAGEAFPSGDTAPGNHDGCDCQLEEAEQHNTGMMLAFLLDPQTAEALAIPDGEPTSELHITLAYLGDMEDEITDDQLRPHTSPFKIRDAIASVASEAMPMVGKIQGIGRFAAPEGEPTPVYAAPDVPGLAEFRTKLINAVEAAGYYVAKDHDFTPHITLAYIPANAPMPITGVSMIPLILDTVHLVVGDNQYDFKLGDEQYPDYWDKKEQEGNLEDTVKLPAIKRQKQEDYNPKTDVWEPPDIDQQIEALKAEGYTHVTWNTLTRGGGCDICVKNDGVTVRIGETFPSGHYLPKAHPHCECGYTPSKEGE